MKLNELLNTCMNQYSNMFNYNQDFKITLLFEKISPKPKEKEYIINGKYTNDENYLLKYSKRIVKYWTMENKNSIVIEIEGEY